MDMYVLLKNGSVVYEGATDPRTNAIATSAPPAAASGYDASLYPARGDGKAAWEAAGRPEYDIAGRQLDPAGWPTGKMKDGSSEGGAPAAPVSLVGGSVWIILPAVESIAEVQFSITEPGAYWLAAGEQSDQNWTLSLNGSPVGVGNSSSDEAAPYQLGTGTGTLKCSFNSAAVSAEQLAARVAAGEGVSKQHYTLRRVA